jgi:O-antigen ligase
MTSNQGKVLLTAVLGTGLAGALYLAHSRPAMFGNTTYLAELLFLQLLVLAIWNFRCWFFPFLMVGFLWAGMHVPLANTWTSGRWALLAAGAGAGVAVYMTQSQHRFGAFHFLAALAVLTSGISAFISDAPAITSLKAGSLLLLFAYAACGGRAAIVGREVRFVAGLITACEIIVYASALFYFVVGLEIWGNPNSLGLAMAITSPVLLWGILTSESRKDRGRRMLAFGLAVALLVWSNSRASLLASALAMTVLCLTLRKKRLVLQGAALALCLVSVLALAAPSKLHDFLSESNETLVYKGHREEGMLGSRKGPWQDTVDSVQQHPWFGTGFGTSAVEERHAEVGVFSSTTATSREHGSSYLAIVEWTGIAGVLPFFTLVLVLFRRILLGVRWLYRTGNAAHPAVPIMLVLLTGLLHAGFEDWLFAVGYYMTVFFWTLAFSFMDFAPVAATSVVSVRARTTPQFPANRFWMPTPGR